ncbi:hypothetical protein [Winogradskyella sp. UBA3174]|uniref:hypothetical protein n=1 Tax=Winogradskyella sp. UBA3174 TaxID=1947785 RepID=UPI0025E6CEC9|nr:hypothetical protein [Winogradskyella sp. UBA3174]
MLNQKKNKRFSYKPRFQDSEEIKSKVDYETKWNDVKGNSKRKANKFTRLLPLIVILVALFVLIYILEGYIN